MRYDGQRKAYPLPVMHDAVREPRRASRGAGACVGAVAKELGLVEQPLRNRINAAKAGSVNDQRS